jgi:hypothetical protein
MSLHDFDDLRAAAAEVARVLVSGGRFCIALLHPMVSARMVEGYAAERRYSFTVERAGLQMTYEGMHRPLGVYFDALEKAGFVVEALREPVALADDGSPYVTSFTFEGASSVGENGSSCTRTGVDHLAWRVRPGARCPTDRGAPLPGIAHAPTRSA